MKPFARLFSHAALAALLLSTVVHALDLERWNNLTRNPSVLTLQHDGIATRPADNSVAVTSASITALPAGTGLRFRALLTPPATGNYTLHISGANAAALWLSPNDSRFEKQRVAWLYESTTSQQWNKFSSQASASVALAADTSYYLKAQVMSSAANGHLAIGWTAPGATSPTLIPIQYLTTLPQDPADLGDNNLPDAWETQYGLDISNLPRAHRETSDPDNDGITNFDEYLLGSDPPL